MADDTKIEPWMWREAVRLAPASVKPTTRLVLLVLADHLTYGDISDGTNVGVEKLQCQTGLSNTAISTHLENARLAGLLRISGRDDDDWRRRRRSTRDDGTFLGNHYYPTFPEWAQTRLRQRLDEKAARKINRQPHEPPSRGPAIPHEPPSRGPRERGARNHVKEVHATYISTDRVTRPNGAQERASDLKMKNVSERVVGNQPAHRLLPSDIQWDHWMAYFEKVGRKGESYSAVARGYLIVPKKWPPRVETE